MMDPETEVREEDEEALEYDEDEDKDEDMTNRIECNEVVLDDGQKIVVSHPRRKNHNRTHKKSPPTTPAKAINENSACLEIRKT
jgi:hypothetical protein